MSELVSYWQFNGLINTQVGLFGFFFKLVLVIRICKWIEVLQRLFLVYGVAFLCILVESRISQQVEIRQL